MTSMKLAIKTLFVHFLETIHTESHVLIDPHPKKEHQEY